MGSYKILFDGIPAGDDFHTGLAKLEVEENADLPGAISFQLAIAAKDGELTWVSDKRIGPFANVAVIATPEGGTPQCIFDGYVLTHEVHVPTGPAGATLDVWGQDSTVLMGMTEKVKEWSGMSDVDVAAKIFGEYGARAAAANAKETAPTHTEEEHTLMQRSSDIDFLRALARRTGRWCRVACDEKVGDRIGYFTAPELTAAPGITIEVNNLDKKNAPVLDFAWDATRPTKVEARQASLTDADPDGVSADVDDSGLTKLDDLSLAEFTGKPRTVRLTAAADTSELPYRAKALLREAAWFARCKGSADVARLGRVPRVGMIVQINGCGALLSGKYLVWSVRHTITKNIHEAAFVLVRNAVGKAK